MTSETIPFTLEQIQEFKDSPPSDPLILFIIQGFTSITIDTKETLNKQSKRIEELERTKGHQRIIYDKKFSDIRIKLERVEELEKCVQKLYKGLNEHVEKTNENVDQQNEHWEKQWSQNVQDFHEFREHIEIDKKNWEAYEYNHKQDVEQIMHISKNIINENQIEALQITCDTFEKQQEKITSLAGISKEKDELLLKFAQALVTLEERCDALEKNTKKEEAVDMFDSIFEDVSDSEEGTDETSIADSLRALDALCTDGKVCKTDEFGCCVECCECKVCIENLNSIRKN